MAVQAALSRLGLERNGLSPAARSGTRVQGPDRVQVALCLGMSRVVGFPGLQELS